MKRFAGFAAFILLTFVFVFVLSSCGTDETLNVYNWGQYIADGKYGSDYNCIDEFEKYYAEKFGKTIHVNYTTFDSNEDMYAKIKTGVADYDVIFPSDYMAQRMISEGLIAELDFSNIPNYANIGEEYRGLFYDEQNKYTVPYTYGVIGIIYNANVIPPEEVESQGWSIFWNEKYRDQMLMLNNSRDAFGVAMYDLGIDVNTTDPAEWQRAYEHLAAQKELVQAYVMDEIYNKMESGEAALGTYYAGDFFTMLDNKDDSVDLRFFQPETTNTFIDVMCVPASSTRKQNAEIFIDFMLQKEPATANAEFIYYATPNTAVSSDPAYIEDLGEAADVLYKEGYDFKSSLNTYGYHNLDQDTLDLINRLWEQMKIETSESSPWIYIAVGTVAVAAIAAVVVVAVRKKKANKADAEDDL